MNILSIPYITGGLSHFLPLYVLNEKLKQSYNYSNYFLVNQGIQKFLELKRIPFVPTNYSLENELIENFDIAKINERILEMELEAFNLIKPDIVIEDCSFITPLIAEKRDIPRISIQRTGIFRSIDEKYRNIAHVHSMQKGERDSGKKSGTEFLKSYANATAKIIPGIPSIECLPENIENKDSYFYSGPLIVNDKPSSLLLERLEEFLEINKGKSIVFITTGTIDRTPIKRYIEYFLSKNYAVITTSDCEIIGKYRKSVFYKKLLPLSYICQLSDLVVHQCGSGMYHYPIINKVPSITVGTRCYDREDVALRIQDLGVSGHVPHPDDNTRYWDIFIDLVERFENGLLVNKEMMNKLSLEIKNTTTNFNIRNVINYVQA